MPSMLGAGNTEMHKTVLAIDDLVFYRQKDNRQTTSNQCAKCHLEVHSNKADEVSKSAWGGARGGTRRFWGEDTSVKHEIIK